MKNNLENRNSANETVEFETRQTIQFIAASFPIERRKEAPLAVIPKPTTYTATWLPPQVVNITLKSGASATSLYVLVFAACLLLYAGFTFTVVNAWDWIATQSFAGVSVLAMIFSALSIVGISFSLIEEDDPVFLLGFFTQRIGVVTLLIGTFVVGGWMTMEGTRWLLTPILGPIAALAIAFVAFVGFVYLLVNRVRHFYPVSMK